MCGCNCGANAPVVYVDLSAVLTRLDALTTILEEHMATETEQLAALDVKLDDLIADVRAALAVLQAEVANLSPEGQAALDAIVAKVDAFDAEVGDAEVPVPPVEPTP